MNIKDADQTAQMRMLVCVSAILLQQNQDFSRRDSFFLFRKKVNHVRRLEDGEMKCAIN